MKKILMTFNDNIITIIFYCILLLLICYLKYRKIKKNENLFNCENLFLIFFYIFIAVGPIIGIIFKNYEYNYNLFLIFGLSLLCFLLGSEIIIGKKKFEISKVKKDKKIKSVNNLSIVKIAKIVLLIGYICSCIYLFKNLSYILSDLENNRVSAMTGNGVIVHLAFMILPSTWILYYYHLNINKIKYIYVIFIIDIILLLLFGFRARILELLLLAIIIRNDYKKIELKKLLSYGLVLVILASGLQAIRSVLSSNNANIFDSLLNTTIVGSINLKHIFKFFPAKVSYQYGYTYLINFMQLLPSYSLDMTMWLKQTMKMTFAGGGVTPTIIGEFYINFGYIGIFIGMTFMGIFCRFIDNCFNQKGINKIFYFIIIFYIARSVTGGLANVSIIAPWFIIVSFVIIKYDVIKFNIIKFMNNLKKKMVRE